MSNNEAVSDAPAHDIVEDLTSSSENSMFAQPSTTCTISERSSADDINEKPTDDKKATVCETNEEKTPGIFCMFPPPPPSINFITEPPLKMLEKLKSMEKETKDDQQEPESTISTIEYNGSQKYQSEFISSEQSTLEASENKPCSETKSEENKLELQNTLTEAFTNVFNEEAQKIGNLANQIVENLKESSGTKDQLTLVLQKNKDLKSFVGKLLHLLQEKTNLSSNLEKQNMALTHQTQSLKDVINITKDLLNIRNMEVEHLHTDLGAMENMIKEERIRHNLSVQRLQEAMKLNEQLKKEYLTQMDLFQKLKIKFTERVLDLSDSNRQFEEFISSRDLKFVPRERVKLVELTNEAEKQ